jgi:hypothetical protein
MTYALRHRCDPKVVSATVHIISRSLIAAPNLDDRNNVDNFCTEAKGVVSQGFESYEIDVLISHLPNRSLQVGVSRPWIRCRLEI